MIKFINNGKSKYNYQTFLELTNKILGETYIQDSLKAYYRYDMNDISGNNNNGTLSGSYTKNSSSIAFNGGHATTRKYKFI